MEEDNQTTPPAGDASRSSATEAQPTTTPTTETKGEVDNFAKMDPKETIFLFGAVPGIIIAVVLLIGTVVYMVRKKKTEKDLHDAMRLDDTDATSGMATSNINTRDMQEMGATREARPVSDIKKK